MFRNFYLKKNHKIANNSTAIKAREKMSSNLESLELKKLMYVQLNLIAILFNKISHRFLLTTKLLKAYLHVRFQSAILQKASAFYRI